YIQATLGGQILLPLAAQITHLTHAQIASTGSGSTIDLSSLTSFAGDPGYDSLTVTTGGSVLDPNLNYFSDVNLTLDPTVTFTLAPNQTYATTIGATTTVTASQLVEQGSLAIPDNAAINLNGALEV